MKPEIQNLIDELLPIAKKFSQTQTARMNAIQVNKLAIIDLELFDHTLNKSCNSCIKTCLQKLNQWNQTRSNIKAEIRKVSPKKKETTNLDSMTYTELKVLAKNKNLETKGIRSKKGLIELLNK